MRFERLLLERYGAFEDAGLDFSGADTRLHVVYGPNEAGKSTVLSGITDLLFGIPHKSTYNFRHDYNRLRLGAEVTNAAGQSLAFKRRKANSGTLLSLGSAETALPDGALAPFLGSLSREQFTRMFGLDHRRLRDGGEQMLRSGGDLARSLFEAGSGLSGVGAALQAIEAEIEAIGKLDGRASKTKPLFAEIDAYTDAVQRVRRDGLKADEWRRAEEVLGLATSAREGIDVALTRLRQRRAGLERIRRAAPVLAVIDTLTAELASFGDLPTLPNGFAEEWRGLERRLRDARLLLQAAEEDLDRRTSELAQAPVAATILRHADAITAAHEQLGRYRKDVADEPKLLRDIANDEALIRAKLNALGLSAEPGPVAALVPPQTVEVRVRGLMLQGEGAEAAAAAASAALAKVKAAYAHAGAALAALPDAAEPNAPAALVDEAARLGDVAARHVKALCDLAQAERDLAESLGRLPGWAGSADALAACPLPDGDTVRLHEESLRDAANRVVAVERRLAASGDEARRIDAELAGLKAAGEVPSPAAVQAARDLRDRGWRVIRARHIEAREPAESDLAALECEGDPAAFFENALRRADELVDRRESEAHRIAQFSRLAADQARLSAQTQADEATLATERAALGAEEARWEALWRDCGVRPETPGTMRAWLSRKDETLRLLARVREARSERDDAETTRDHARRCLRRAAEALGLRPSDEATAADLDREVRQALGEATRGVQERQAAARALAEIAERMRGHEAAAEAAERAVATWREQWSDAAVALGLQPNASRPEAELALSAWSEIRQRHASKEQFVRRLSGIRRDNEAFRAELARLVDALGPEGPSPTPGTDLEGTVLALLARLADARQAAATHARSVEDRRIAADKLDAARREAERAAEACDAFRQAFGLSSDMDVLPFAERAGARARALQGLQERRTALAVASDGIAEAAIRAELSETTPDAAAAELALLQGEEDRLVAEGQAAAQHETSARHALETLAGRESVAAAAQRARHHAQAAGMHLERWLQLATAKRLLERALERYRTENQHPLVRRGGEIFAALAATGENPIVRLDVVYGDGTDPTLVGIRRDGSECRVEGMSEGTRDQLYLALRMAAVEQHVAEHEPMPFVADDLFITSDEDRVAAGLAALAALGCKTQVILFTHHQHVARLASLLPGGGVRLHRLPIPRALEEGASHADALTG
ncbi:YhaN family protein [Salinarimonas soli]|uniref:AAA family ATPase n=1 Tax=Salinarimonas soli TaxID=1638099 RepID=A0A5B2VQ57_9HYPH|nr:YhaN family protein [Salinarimonas soli]KAA2241175.1 AAA family ATPase [Salinarimonas soli]